MLVELRLGDVAGFDLSVMDAYRWHPHLERVNLSKCVSTKDVTTSSVELLQHLCFLQQVGSI
jgi:hypothetical protein